MTLALDRATPRVLGVDTAFPPHYVDQDTILEGLRLLWRGHATPDRVEQLHRATRVRGRHLAAAVADYPALDTFPKKNAVWERVALEVGEEAVRGALAAARVGPRDVDALFFTTVTGIAVPSIDAQLMNRVGFRSDVKRTPLFGLGCVAGAAGVARAQDFLRAYPEGVALLLAVELCSLTLQRDDLSVANLIASGLFGDGGAAVVLGGGARFPERTPGVVATRSVFYPDTQDVMGWAVVDGGFKVLLSGKVPEVARERIGRDVDAFLKDLGLARGDVKHWLCHTGGPRVLEAFEEALALPREALARSWRSLEENGNLSSASVLLVLADALASGDARPGDLGLMIAMGPGFCAELVLLRW